MHSTSSFWKDMFLPLIAPAIALGIAVGTHLYDTTQRKRANTEKLRREILNDLDEMRRHLIMVLHVADPKRKGDVDQFLASTLRNALQYHSNEHGLIKYDPILRGNELEEYKILIDSAWSQDLLDKTNSYIERVNKEETRIRNLKV